MSTPPPNIAVILASGLGTTLSAMVGFGSLSLWYYFCPALVEFPTQQIERQFSVVFERGKATIPKLSMAACAVFAYCAWDSFRERGATVQCGLYIVSAVLAMANGPWTVMVMWPAIQELSKRSTGIVEGIETKETDTKIAKSWVETASSIQLVRNFGFLSLPRGMFGISASLVATIARAV